MFTGIIEAIGVVGRHTIKDNQSRLVLSSAFPGTEVGESIAVNGVCLTALPSGDAEIHFDLSKETLDATTLKNLKAGDRVNLERAMSARSRFGGHYVSGHVDTTVFIESIQVHAECRELVLSGFNEEAKLYILPKGSITVDGVSLTINTVNSGCVSIMLIPHTVKETIFSEAKKGQEVNIEFDYLTRIVAHQMRVVSRKDNEVMS